MTKETYERLIAQIDEERDKNWKKWESIPTSSPGYDKATELYNTTEKKLIEILSIVNDVHSYEPDYILDGFDPSEEDFGLVFKAIDKGIAFVLEEKMNEKPDFHKAMEIADKIEAGEGPYLELLEEFCKAACINVRPGIDYDVFMKFVEEAEGIFGISVK